MISGVLGPQLQGLVSGGYQPAEFHLDLEDEDGLAINGTSLGPLFKILQVLEVSPRHSGDSCLRMPMEEWFEFKGVLSSLPAVPLLAAVLLFGASLISLVGLGAKGLRNLRGTKAITNLFFDHWV